MSEEWGVEEQPATAIADGVGIDSPLPTLHTPLGLTAELYSSGLNGALRRWPAIETQAVSLFDRRSGLTPSWKPHWAKVPTVGLMFPAGFEFAPKKSDDSEPESFKKIEPPKAASSDLGESADRPLEKKTTRLKPPSDAISLFYLLQPPLQTMLAGQELIMPFEPFPYQYEGIAWLFSQKQALLADEMGLGKTMQTITAIRLLLRGGQIRRVLMVCPKPLIPNWQREFKAWAEELPITVLEGDGPRRRMLWQMPAPILLVNYELMVRNRDSCTSETARSIPRKRSWALTGTPIENRPEEMHTLFEYMTVIPKGGTPDLRQMQRLSRDFVLRRTKDRVMKDMPPRLDRNEFLELTPNQKDAYQTAERDGVIHLNEMGDQATVQHVFELVLRLKQITNYDPLTGDSVKFERLAADMEEIAASGGKAILFSQWTKTIDWLKERLPNECGTLVYHGGVPTKQREPILKQFKEDPNSHLLLMSYGTGAVGLNLQFAGYVFLYDRWWHPAVERREERGHRHQIHLQGHHRGADRQSPARETRTLPGSAWRRQQLERIAQPVCFGNLRPVRPESSARQGNEEDCPEASGRRVRCLHGFAMGIVTSRPAARSLVLVRLGRWHLRHSDVSVIVPAYR
ncbi:MAG: SNF2-related protein [Planctomycetota bacterium]|nr:MAG: SNF2-related protein [Planctomycetota bacterium]